MPTLTFRTVFEKATVLSLLAEPEFAGNWALQVARDVKPSDHYFAIFVRPVLLNLADCRLACSPAF
jgi:hypothetical protein